MNLACLTAGYYRLLVDSRRSIFNVAKSNDGKFKPVPLKLLYHKVTHHNVSFNSWFLFYRPHGKSKAELSGH